MEGGRLQRVAEWTRNHAWEIVAIIGAVLIIGGAYLLASGMMNTSTQSEQWPWNWVVYIFVGGLTIGVAVSGAWCREKGIREGRMGIAWIASRFVAILLVTLAVYWAISGFLSGLQINEVFVMPLPAESTDAWSPAITIGVFIGIIYELGVIVRLSREKENKREVWELTEKK